MSIRELRNEISKLKKTLAPECHPDRGVVVLYKGEIKDKDGNFSLDSILAIDGMDVSAASKSEIQAVIDNAKTLFLFPDNGRDSGMWKPWNLRVFGIRRT